MGYKENMELLNDLCFLLLPRPANHLPGPLSKWLPSPSKGTISVCLYTLYFLLIGGVVYDIQYQPQGMGQYVDKTTGQMRPMTFVQGRINAQFLIEGFVASIMTAIGAFGWITVNYANQDGLQRRSRMFLMSTGLLSIISSLIALHVFLSMKLPNYI